MKFVSFFIHVENGRRRPGLSVRSGIWVSLDGGDGEGSTAARLCGVADLVSNSALGKGMNEQRCCAFLVLVPCGCGAVSVVAIVLLSWE